jgi:uncharacterized protein (DUF169 family)
MVDYRSIEERLARSLALTRRPVTVAFAEAPPVGLSVSFLGRPTCMALPAALASGVVASTGCIGNRVYTDLGDEELYVAVPGKALAAVTDEIGTIAAANATLAEYHRERRQALATE